MPVVVFVLSAAVFAQGTSEFMLSGLLARIAADTGVSVGAAGLLTSLFAVGMVVGAPLMAMVALPRRTAMIGFLAAFGVSHVVGALTTDFAVLLGTRLVAAVANAGFLAVALAGLPVLVPAAAVGRATSVILSGVTLACVVGVPAGTVLGQALGWHAAFWAVAVVSVVALGPLWVLTSRVTLDAPASDGAVWREWSVLGDRRLAVVVGLGVLVNAATFAAFTYLGTIAGAVGSVWVPVTLALFGVGAFAGVTVAGRVGERLITVGTVVLVGMWLAAVPAVRVLPGLLVAAVVTGACAFGVGSALIGAIVRRAAPAAPRVAGALATTAFNVGAVAGPVAAGVAVDAEGATAALWVSVAFTAVAAVLATVRRG